MKIIRQVEIRKFRSIKSSTRDLTFSDLNILVGQNDNGKSNVLRALNLFFNSETDVGQGFRFEDDYCYHADSGTGTRREIRIDLLIDPPQARFKHAKPVRWTKRWKRDGSVIEDRIYLEDGSPISPKDNVSKWLDKLNYRYVPAIKGRDYFNALMGDLHDVLHEAHGDIMTTQGEGFISGIQKITKGITRELAAQIGVPNTIQVPSDFRLLFSNLDFGSKDGANTYHLKQRGDGIKVRHIPVILKYMAEQEKNIAIPGYVKPDTIWGFEEPENNLELKYAFELANTFREYAKDIQILVTTHSPAFYSLHSDSTDSVRTFFVRREGDLCTTIKQVEHGQGANLHDLHDHMGLLPLITPYLKDIYAAELRIQALEDKISMVADDKKCLVITEDKNSKAIKAIFAASGFRLKETEFFSYNGKDQIKGALILGKYLREKKPDVTVVVHRDRDYLTTEEVSSYADTFIKHQLHFFCTNGVDAESHFLTPEHISAIGIPLAGNELEMLINQATTDARKDSLSRLIDQTLLTTKPENGAYAKLIQSLNDKYDKDPERYRYGKKVLGHLKSRLQKALKENVDLEVSSTALKVESLKQIADSIWGTPQ